MKKEEKSTVKYEEVGNIEDKIFMAFEIYLKQSKMTKKTHNY